VIYHIASPSSAITVHVVIACHWINHEIYSLHLNTQNRIDRLRIKLNGAGIVGYGGELAVMVQLAAQYLNVSSHIIVPQANHTLTAHDRG
jgi:hypothetical protein